MSTKSRLEWMPDSSRSPARNRRRLRPSLERYRRRRRRRSPEYRDWAQLPRDVLSLIFRKLRAVEILWPAQAVCYPWRHLAFDPQVWRCIDMRNHAGLFDMNDLEKMAMEAANRSGGHVEEFYAEGFLSDKLLRYIAKRSTGLRCSVQWGFG